MPLRVHRVCRAMHSRLDGEGAMRAGGRWNSKGKRVVYMAETVSLAVLENLVHMAREDFPSGFVVVTADMSDRVKILTPTDLRAPKATPEELGNYWIESRISAVLKVRSSVNPFEHNYLLNPLHRDFADIHVLPPEVFIFDERLFGR